MKNRSAVLVLFGILMCGALHAQPPAYVPTDGLQLWYSFNDSLQPYDAGANDINASVGNVSPAMDREGNQNSSVIFEEPNASLFADIADVANFPFVTGDPAISINFWYSASVFEQEGTLAECYQYGNPYGGWRIAWEKLADGSAEITASYQNNNTDSCTASVIIPEYDFAWHMSTVVFNSSGATIYMDGSEAGTGTWTGASGVFIQFPFNFSGLLYLGNWGNGTSNEAIAFKGRLDEFGLWSRQLTQTEITNLGSVPAIAGCGNSNACNYNPEFLINDFNCSFECLGCMDPYSCNYDQNATISAIDSCEYDCIIDTICLFGFLDLNQNGSYDEQETPLQNWPIKFSGPDAASAFTNEAGYFILPVHPGEYIFEIDTFSNGASSWNSALINPITPGIQSLLFPSSTDTLFFSLAPGPSVTTSATARVLEGYSLYYDCQTGYTSGLFIQNTGNEILNGTITLDCDLGFTPGADSSETIGPDIFSPGHCEWYVENFMPGSERMLAFHVLGDTSVIESYSFTYSIALLDGSSNPILNEAISNTIEVNCDDMGDGVITANPQGFFAPHYVLPGEPILYRVAFQNNTDEYIQRSDLSMNFNSQSFDLRTVDVLYASEYYVGCLHDDGTLALRIDRSEISPSSIDSSGSVVFMLVAATLREDLLPGHLIDVDPIVQLNGDTISIERYRHEIFNCQSFVGPELFNQGNSVYSDGVLTQTIFQDDSTNFFYSLAAANPYADNYLWIINGDTMSYQSSINIESNGANEVTDLSSVQLLVGNDLCSESFDFDLIIGLNEPITQTGMIVYPNPFSANCTVVFPDYNYNLSLVDIAGRIVRQWSNCPKTLEVTKESLQPGYYRLISENGDNHFSLPVIVE